jgi:cold shock protein
VIVAPDVLGDCFDREGFANIEMSGYRELRARQQVRFTYEDPGFLQDGCRFRALQVWPETCLRTFLTLCAALCR